MDAISSPANRSACDAGSLAGLAFLNAAMHMCHDGRGAVPVIEPTEWADAVGKVQAKQPIDCAEQLLDMLCQKPLRAPHAAHIRESLQNLRNATGQSLGKPGKVGGVAANFMGDDAPAPAAASPSKAPSKGKLSGIAANFMNDEAQPPAPAPTQASPPKAKGKVAAAFLANTAEEGSPSADKAPAPKKINVAAAFLQDQSTDDAKPTAGKRSGGGKWNGEGAYLTYENANNGTLFMVFSKAKVDGALGFAQSSKPIPAFKFTTGGGKTELMRGASDKVAYFRGVAAFVKAAKSLSASVDCDDASGPFPSTIVVHYPDNRVEAAKTGEPINVTDVDAVAVVPKANTELSGVNKMEKQLFIQRGDTIGATAS